MSTIPPNTKSVKSKADYIALAEAALMQSEWQNDKNLFEGEQNSLKRASIYATLAIAAPDEAAPADYLAVCAERDELRRQVTNLVFAGDTVLKRMWAKGERGVDLSLLRTAIQNAEQTADPENAE